MSVCGFLRTTFLIGKSSQQYMQELWLDIKIWNLSSCKITVLFWHVVLSKDGCKISSSQMLCYNLTLVLLHEEMKSNSFSLNLGRLVTFSTHRIWLTITIMIDCLKHMILYLTSNISSLLIRGHDCILIISGHSLIYWKDSHFAWEEQCL